MVTQDLENKITSIAPVYDESILGGHFSVTFGLESVFNLNFSSFLRHRFEKDEPLKDYVRTTNRREDVTTSSIVQDLYEIGCPVEEWVHEHFADVRSKVSQFDALIQLYLHLKQFGDDQHTRDNE